MINQRWGTLALAAYSSLMAPFVASCASRSEPVRLSYFKEVPIDYIRPSVALSIDIDLTTIGNEYVDVYVDNARPARCLLVSDLNQIASTIMFENGGALVTKSGARLVSTRRGPELDPGVRATFWLAVIERADTCGRSVLRFELYGDALDHVRSGESVSIDQMAIDSLSEWCDVAVIN